MRKVLLFLTDRKAQQLLGQSGIFSSQYSRVCAYVVQTLGKKMEYMQAFARIAAQRIFYRKAPGVRRKMSEEIRSRFEKDSISLDEGADYMIRHNASPLNGNVSLHYHDHYEAFFAMAGGIRYTVEERTYSLKAGNLLLIAPYRLHQSCIHTNRYSERISVRFSAAPPQRLLPAHSGLLFPFPDELPALQFYLDEGQQEQMHGLLQGILREREERAPGNETVIKALLTCFFVLLERVRKQKSGTAEKILPQNVRELVRYLEDNFSAPVTGEELEQKFYKNYSQLSREFKATVGVSPHQYLLQKRLLNARKLLAEGIPPREAAHRSGFCDYTNFYRQFCRQYGASPKECRRKFYSTHLEPKE